MIQGSMATDYDKAVIAGHYIFHHTEFLEAKKTAQEVLDIDMDCYLRKAVKKAIYRYLYHFNLISKTSRSEALIF